MVDLVEPLDPSPLTVSPLIQCLTLFRSFTHDLSPSPHTHTQRKPLFPLFFLLFYIYFNYIYFFPDSVCVCLCYYNSERERERGSSRTEDGGHVERRGPGLPNRQVNRQETTPALCLRVREGKGDVFFKESRRFSCVCVFFSILFISVYLWSGNGCEGNGGTRYLDGIATPRFEANKAKIRMYKRRHCVSIFQWPDEERKCFSPISCN